jgi:hypothetical protein
MKQLTGLSQEQRAVLAVLLRDVRQGKLTTVGVLADWLDDVGHGRLAGKVRRVFVRWQSMTLSWRTYFLDKVRFHSLSHYLLPWHRWARARVLKLLGQPVRAIGREGLLRHNAFTPLLPRQDGEF